MDGKQNTGATQEVIMSVVFSVLENSNIIFRLNCATTVFERIRNTRNSVSFRGRVTSSSTRPRYKVGNPSSLMTFGDLKKLTHPSSRHLDETAGNNIDTLCHGGDVLAVGDSFYDTYKCGYFRLSILINREMERTLAFGQTMSFVRTTLLCVE